MACTLDVWLQKCINWAAGECKQRLFLHCGNTGTTELLISMFAAKTDFWFSQIWHVSPGPNSGLSPSQQG